MKEDFKEKTNKNCELIKQELIRLGFKNVDTHAIEKEVCNKNIYFVIYPDFIYNNNKLEVWYAVRFELENEDSLKHYEFTDKNFEIFSELRKIFKQSKYKFFHDEDAVAGMFSHPQPDNHGYFKYKGYCNPEIPGGAWSNHALN